MVKQSNSALPCFEKMSILERKQYFGNYFIAHPHIYNATKLLQNYVNNSVQESSPPMIFVVGPSGVGKTTMINKIRNDFWDYAINELGYNNSYIPIVIAEAIAPDQGNFDWRDHYRRTLLELKEPLIEHKIDYNSLDIGEKRTKINPRSTRADLRLSLENAFRYRKVKVNIIDEAQHLAIVSSGRKLQDQMETLKSLSNKSGVMMVLVGTYNLLTLLNINGQLSRRSQIIHLPRYDLKNEEDEINFIAILNAFQERIPFSETPDLVKSWDYFYERSIGCIGILKNWMGITINNALDNQKPTISLMDFEKYALSVKQCTKMLWDAKNGEDILTDNEDEKRLLRTHLGLDGVSDQQIITQTNQTKRKRTSVGERSPGRDPVGGISNEGVL